MDLVVRQILIITITGLVVPVVFISISSLIVATIQAVTQIQEQSVGYLVKLITLILVLYFGSGLIENQMLQLTINCLQAMIRVN
jgi:type III secretory pathway component EscS